ncbi:zinc finger MYM-type protein 5-like [Hydra vulgaris]|uniref:Zinc finger MYM-type protein 5-like n=1 Tax=Hydra vulgaris TaxID=6087 RepID=A0ABM4BZJ2_HYDVU
MNSTWLKRRLANGDEVGRSWLLYSSVNEAAYCFCCLLFPTSNSNSQFSFESADGFTNWRYTERLKNHKNSLCHCKSFTIWKEAERRLIYGKGIDSELEAQIESEKQQWGNILKRILSCIKVLASQNVVLRGHGEKLSTAEEGANI